MEQYLCVRRVELPHILGIRSYRNRHRISWSKGGYGDTESGYMAYDILCCDDYPALRGTASHQYLSLQTDEKMVNIRRKGRYDRKVVEFHKE